jgi:hypothetical protein
LKNVIYIPLTHIRILKMLRRRSFNGDDKTSPKKPCISRNNYIVNAISNDVKVPVFIHSMNGHDYWFYQDTPIKRPFMIPSSTCNSIFSQMCTICRACPDSEPSTYRGKDIFVCESIACVNIARSARIDMISVTSVHRMFWQKLLQGILYEQISAHTPMCKDLAKIVSRYI